MADSDSNPIAFRITLGALVAILIVVAVAAPVTRNAMGCNRAPRVVHEMPFAASDLERRLRSDAAGQALFSQGSILIAEWSESAIRLTYTFYDGVAMTQTIAAEAGTGIAKLVIDRLIDVNFNPRKNHTAIFVFVRQPAAPSVTGAAQVLVFGDAYYDWNTDQLSYEVVKP